MRDHMKQSKKEREREREREREKEHCTRTWNRIRTRREVAVADPPFIT
jgi:hypothetical protein